VTKRELPEVLELFHALSGCLSSAVGFDGSIYRSAGVRYANEEDFLSGVGSFTFGGRWNRPGMAAIYGSLDILTAVKESYQAFFDYGFSPENIKPRVFAGAAVQLQRVLDLSSAGIRRRIGFSLAELLDEDWGAIQNQGDESWTQVIGRGCRNAGFEGIIAPSARDRPKGKNLIYFPDRLESGSHATLLGKGDLPPHPSEWRK